MNSNRNQTTGSERSIVAHHLRLREFGITDKRLLSTIETIRHDQFVPTSHIHMAWGQRTLPLICGQTMLSPLTTARVVAALRLTGSETVLDIGTGSGYQAALISRLCRKVHSVDRYAGLVASARRTFTALELPNVTLAHADGLTSAGRTGQGGQALYDRIVSECAFAETPRDLLDQLASGGIVVVPIGPANGEQTLVRLTKVGSRFEREDLFQIRSTTIVPGLSEAL